MVSPLPPPVRQSSIRVRRISVLAPFCSRIHRASHTTNGGECGDVDRERREGGERERDQERARGRERGGGLSHRLKIRVKTSDLETNPFIRAYMFLYF